MASNDELDIQIGSGKFTFCCQLCGRKFFNARQCQDHQDQDHHNCNKRNSAVKNPKVYNCTDCSSYFYSGVELLQHEKSYHSFYQCEICYEMFKTPRTLNSHISKKHRDNILSKDDAPLSGGGWYD